MTRMFRWILDDTRALIADLRALFRRLSTRLQWMRMTSKHRVDNAAAELENVRRSASTRTRMCTACRALIPINVRACPECGEVPGRRVSAGFSRVIDNMIPGAVSVTSVLLTLNMLFYALTLFIDQQLSSGGWRGSSWNTALVALGANTPALALHGEPWRLATYIFLHGGLLHLLMNSWALLTVGPLVEELYGPSRYFLIYLATGVAGGLVSSLRNPGDWAPHIGASGAIFGLIGVAAVWGWRRGGSYGAGIRAQMVQWAIYGLAMGFLMPFIDNAAHIGGLLCGGLMGLLLGDAGTARGVPKRLWDITACACALGVAASFALVGMRYAEIIRTLSTNP